MKKIIFFLFFGFLLSAFCLNAQSLFSVNYNLLSHENVIQLNAEIANTEISTLLITRDNENREHYSISFSSAENTQLIILNEINGCNVVITPVRKSLTEFHLTPFFMEELRQSVLGEAAQYLLLETTPGFSVRNVASVAVSNDGVNIPRYFYGKKENVQEALPKERKIIKIIKQKPQLISAFPDDPAHQRYIAQLEEEMSYYVYIYQLPNGTKCTYDEHFNKDGNKNRSSVGNFLEFSLSGELNEMQRLATEFALELWSEQLAGSVPVDIEVDIVPLGDGILGMSFFPTCFQNSDTEIWYPAALWNQIVGYNANSEWDIKIVMSSKYSFYYGLDGNTTGMDYVTIMLHEVTHGLGFGCYCSHDDGEFFYGAPGIYDCMLYKGLNGPCFTELTPNERAALMVSNNLYAGRPNSNLLEANNGVRVKMYAPFNYSGGSSAHHWDNNMSFINFMQYAYQYPLHTFNNRKMGILTDMGWTIPEIDPNAVWVTFHANGGGGTRNPQPFLPNEPQKLKINTFYLKGYSSTGWNTSPEGTGVSYTDREIITINENTDLFAQWEANTYTLKFFTVGGGVNPTSKQVTFDAPIGEMPIPIREGYRFVEWRIGAKKITNETIWNYIGNRDAIAIWERDNSISETQQKESVSLTPNPTTGELQVTSYELQVTEVEVYDVYGRKQNIQFHSYGLTVLRSYGLSNLPAGIYFVKIFTEKGEIVKKIVKQ